MRFAKVCSTAIFICLIVVFLSSLVYSQSELSIDERIALVEKKIEAGTARGDIPRHEHSKLKSRLAVVKHKRARLETVRVTEQAYKDLDHYLYGLEKDTDRWLSGVKGR
ncbi:MAG TPA: hypothetical protein VMB78_07325 [Dissulfurispiraceae bacterium]|nr:hypothetical protein [Dissulfurispiraceae bacterium]